MLFAAAAAALLFTTGAAAAPESKDHPQDKVICKRVYEADTGSHFQSSKRICHTAAEWQDIDQGTERVMKTIRDNGSLVQGLGGTGLGGTPQ
jgi:hypothetical protein